MLNQATDVAQASRRWASEQALASASVEGHVPSPEYLQDCQAVIDGTITTEEAATRSLARALAAASAAARAKG